jgi:dTDP-4-amino-4,6-dideoxygalactose transaminase
MLVTDNENIIQKVVSLRDHGASKSDLQRHREKGGSLLPEFHMRGYNYRMTDLQGALGVCQMKKAKDIIEKRRSVAKKYDNALKDIDKLVTPYVPAGFIHGYQSYVCLFVDIEDMENLSMDKIHHWNLKRNKFMMHLEERGISTRQGTHAVHTLEYYRKKFLLHDADYLNSYAADRLSVALPLYSEMSDKEFEYVISNIKEVCK